MTGNSKKIKDLLDANIPSEAVSVREGGNGVKLSYLTGFYVIKVLNEILGQGNWFFQVCGKDLVDSTTVEGKYGDKFSAHYLVHGVLTAFVDGKQVNFSDYGYGNGYDKTEPGKAHELAIKEASTDALKRCAKNLGMATGLALYDKTQEFVGDQEQTTSNSGGTDQRKSSSVLPTRPSESPKSNVTNSGQNAERNESPGLQKPSPIGGESEELSREKAISAIGLTSRVIVAKKIRTADELRAMLRTAGADKKEDLNETQARVFHKQLKEILDNVTNQ